MFVSKAVREGEMPFAVTTAPDPFFSKENVTRIRDSIESVGYVHKTFADLKAMENE
jgi:hypothetical protein